MYASKAASQELLGALQFSNGLPDSMIIVPVQAIIDYKGFRCVCVPALPITRDSLCYGFNDAGNTMVSKYEFIAERMRSSAKSLHLASHLVNSVEYHNVGDVEIHFGKDGNFYLIDLARMFSPESPEKACEFHGDEYSRPRGVFFRMLHPELLQMIKEVDALPPVSSDSLSLWGNQKREKYDPITIWTTDFMFCVQIPALADFLDRKTNAPLNISLCFHQYGVNMRHIGLVGWISRTSHIRNASSQEIATRVLKQMLRSQLRKDHLAGNFSSDLNSIIDDFISDVRFLMNDSKFRQNLLQQYGSKAVQLYAENRGEQR